MNRLDTIKELLKKYKKGDKEALNQIMILMTPLVKKICRQSALYGERGFHAGILYHYIGNYKISG